MPDERWRGHEHHGPHDVAHAPVPVRPLRENHDPERPWYAHWQELPESQRERILRTEFEAAHHHRRARVAPVLGHRTHRPTSLTMIMAILIALAPGAYVVAAGPAGQVFETGGQVDSLAAAPAQVTVCHLAGVDKIVRIEVSLAALPAHQAHGDPPCPPDDPGGNNTDPGGNNTDPGGNNTDPGGNNTDPGGNNTDPGGNNTDPGGNNTDPGGNNTDPGGNNTDPGGNNTDSGGNSTGPGGNNTNGTGNVPPVAAFDWDCTRLACDFDATASTDGDGNITRYNWTFGDTEGNGSTPSHTFPAAGTYNVTLTVTDDATGTHQVSQLVTVATSSGGGGGGGSVRLAAEPEPAPVPTAGAPAPGAAPDEDVPISSDEEPLTILVPIPGSEQASGVPAAQEFLPIADNRGQKRPDAHDAAEDEVGIVGHAHGVFDAGEFDFGEGHSYYVISPGAEHGYTHFQDRADQFPDNTMLEV